MSTTALEHYRDRPVEDRNGDVVPSLVETLNSKGLSWRHKGWDPATGKEGWNRLFVGSRDEAIKYVRGEQSKDTVDKKPPRASRRLGTVDAEGTFSGPVAEYVTWMEKNLAGNSVRLKTGHLKNHIIPVLGRSYFSELEARGNSRKVMEVITRMEKAGYEAKGGTVPYADSALQAVWTTLSGFLTWACLESVDYMGKNPCHVYKKKELYFIAGAVKPVDVREVPTTDTIYALVRDERQRNAQQARMMEFAFETGMRISEILALKQSSFDWQDFEIHVTHAIQTGGPETKNPAHRWPELGGLKGDISRGGGLMRKIPMSDRAIEIIREQLAFQHGRGMYDWFFSTSNGTPFHPNDCTRFLTNAYERTGITRFGNRLWHGFRHAFATESFRTPGLTIEQISRYLGHRDVEMTRSRYVAFLNMRAEGDAFREAKRQRGLTVVGAAEAILADAA